MKVIYILVLLLLSSVLLSQVDFYYDFSLNKVNPEDELVKLWIDDLDEDGENEIYAGYRYFDSNNNISEIRIVEYNLEGNIVTAFVLSDSRLLLNCSLINFQNTNYLILAFRNIDSTTHYLNIVLYNFTTLSLISSLSSYIGNQGNISGTLLTDINFIEPVVFQNELTFNIGLEKHYYYYSDVDETHNCFSELYQAHYDNGNLILVANLDNCGKELIDYDGFENLVSIGSSTNTFFWPGHVNEVEHTYNLNLISLPSPSQIYNILTLNGLLDLEYYHFPTDITILSRNNCSFLEFGSVIYFKLLDSNLGDTFNFINYSSDFTDTLWYDQNTIIIENEITATTCVSVNYENHYLMYFNEDQLEIRNRVNGNIIHHQNSSINPISILKKINGELLFITENGPTFDVFILDGEIQVSTDDNQISIVNYELQNYPNPFNPETNIVFNLRDDGKVQLDIFNIKGQKIKSLLSDQIKAGEHSIVWNGEDTSSKKVGSGVYLFKLNVNGKTEAVKKCLLLK